MSGSFEIVGLPTLLGIETTARLAEGIQRAVRGAGTGLRLVGVWDAETHFACAVEVCSAGPMLWHFAGPLDETQAAAWLGIRQLDAEASFATIN